LTVLGVALICTGLSIAAWISRPYITFLLSTSKIEALEKKAESFEHDQVYTIKNSELIGKTAVFPETTNKVDTEEKAVVGSGFDDQKAVSIVQPENISVDTQVAEVVPVRRNENMSGNLKAMAEILKRDVMKKSEAMQKKADSALQSKENRIIIPTALVDAPILEGVDMEKLSEGVCHVTKSSFPGQGGNYIIEGHNLGEFGWLRPQGPFSMLEIMDKGVPIYVFYKGKKYIYRAKEKIYTDVNDPKLYDFNPGERLTLITCTSTWDITVYTTKRTIIIAYPE